jgi:hypothetical protein
MKKNQIPVALKASLFFLACVIIFGFSERASSNGVMLTESQFHDNIASIVNGEGISQEDLAQTMSAAEQRKSGSQTASDYVEDYMNAHFKATPAATMATENRVSIASPGQPDLRMNTPCNQTALQTLTTGAIGYYYAFATRCDGTYKYDAENYTGGSTVYVRAEASTYILEAFILF